METIPYFGHYNLKNLEEPSPIFSSKYVQFTTNQVDHSIHFWTVDSYWLGLD